MAYITKDQMREILRNAPPNADKTRILKALAEKGNMIAGYNAPEEGQPGAPIDISKTTPGQAPQRDPEQEKQLQQVQQLQEAFNRGEIDQPRFTELVGKIKGGTAGQLGETEIRAPREGEMPPERGLIQKQFFPTEREVLRGDIPTEYIWREFDEGQKQAQRGIDRFGQPGSIGDIVQGVTGAAMSPITTTLGGFMDRVDPESPGGQALNATFGALAGIDKFAEDRLVEVYAPQLPDMGEEEVREYVRKNVMPDVYTLIDLATLGAGSKATKSARVRNVADDIITTTKKIDQKLTDLTQGGARATREGITGLAKGVQSIGEDIVGAFKRSPSIADEIAESKKLVITNDMTPVQKATIARRQAELDLPKLTRVEKSADIAPATKKYVAQEPEKAKTYLEKARAAKADPKKNVGALGYGGERVEETYNKVKNVLNDKGGDIGKFRTANAAKKAGVDDMVKIENSIMDNLDNLELDIIDGKVVQKEGAQKLTSQSEINELQTIWDNYQVLDKNPTMDELLKFRNTVNNKVKFGQRSGAVTGNLDNLNNEVAFNVRQANRNMLDEGQRQLYEEYATLVGAKDEMETYVKSRSGGEFLLKRALSEKDRAPKELFETIQKYTGEDLYNDARFAAEAVRVVGDPLQTSVFQKEIGKATFDALMGGPAGKVRAAGDVAKSIMQKDPDVVYEGMINSYLK